MKRYAPMLAIAALALAVAAGSSAAGGGPATVLLGGQGVLAPNGKVRYVAVTTGRQTIVSFVRVRGGEVFRWRQLPGYFGVPMISIDGTTDGVSRDGTKLVLATPPGGVTTQFAVIDTRTLKLRRVKLLGSWSYDAVSPDASTLFLVQYSGTGANAAYQVRAFDLGAGRLLARPVVDRRIGERLMRGRPVTRATSSDGRWAYTLYARQKRAPFVHALDTVQRRAYCIDLPLELAQAKQLALRLRLGARDRELRVRQAGVAVAVLDTHTFVVRTEES